MLPEMSGYLVLKKIREGFHDESTAIVMASSLAHAEDVTSCLKLGIQGYIVKPFQPKDIGKRILEYCKLHATG